MGRTAVLSNRGLLEKRRLAPNQDRKNMRSEQLKMPSVDCENEYLFPKLTLQEDRPRSFVLRENTVSGVSVCGRSVCMYNWLPAFRANQVLNTTLFSQTRITDHGKRIHRYTRRRRGSAQRRCSRRSRILRVDLAPFKNCAHLVVFKISLVHGFI